jgi:hypothetical protein
VSNFFLCSINLPCESLGGALHRLSTPALRKLSGSYYAALGGFQRWLPWAASADLELRVLLLCFLVCACLGDCFRCVFWDVLLVLLFAVCVLLDQLLPFVTQHAAQHALWLLMMRHLINAACCESLLANAASTLSESEYSLCENFPYRTCHPQHHPQLLPNKTPTRGQGLHRPQPQGFRTVLLTLPWCLLQVCAKCHCRLMQCQAAEYRHALCSNQVFSCRQLVLVEDVH